MGGASRMGRGRGDIVTTYSEGLLAIWPLARLEEERWVPELVELGIVSGLRGGELTKRSVVTSTCAAGGLSGVCSADEVEGGTKCCWRTWSSVGAGMKLGGGTGGEVSVNGSPVAGAEPGAVGGPTVEGTLLLCGVDEIGTLVALCPPRARSIRRVRQPRSSTSTSSSPAPGGACSSLARARCRRRRSHWWFWTSDGVAWSLSTDEYSLMLWSTCPIAKPASGLVEFLMIIVPMHTAAVKRWYQKNQWRAVTVG